MTAELTIVVPTYNEYGNIQPFIDAIKNVMKGHSWELIFIDDDSTDGSYRLIGNIARTDTRVRCIRRVGRKGLSSACIEGILASSSPYVCVMDADMQHDESILPDMLERLKSGDEDIVIGSRYTDAGSIGNLPRYRVFISRAATRLGNFLLPAPVSDPMSGFFMLKKEFFDSVVYQLSGKGFKILLDILVSSDRAIKVTELPYTMRQRDHGESKLGFMVVLEFFYLLIEKLFGHLLPRRFVAFSMVGLSGVMVHLCVLWLMHRFFMQMFLPSQALATLVAMTSNFILNNMFTYRDKRLRGADFFRGLFNFYIACSFGALINIALASMLYEFSLPWWLAGIAGAVAGAVWNYAITAIVTWGSKEPGKE